MQQLTWHAPDEVAMQQLTWHAPDEVLDELCEVEADIEQYLRILVDVALQVLARTVDVLHERRRQTLSLCVQNVAVATVEVNTCSIFQHVHVYLQYIVLCNVDTCTCRTYRYTSICIT